MTAAQLLAYLGPAAVWAALATAVLWSAHAALARRAGRRADPRAVPTLALALFFLILTQHPLPDPATLDCTQGGVAPILRPFATLDHVGRLWVWTRNDPARWPGAWLGSKVLQAAAANLILPALIGAAYARHAGGRRPRARALALAVALSGGAELAQATALFGLYPCPWRTFETDDLILNIGGLMLGFALMRGCRRRLAGPG